MSWGDQPEAEKVTQHSQSYNNNPLALSLTDFERDTGTCCHGNSWSSVEVMGLKHHGLPITVTQGSCWLSMYPCRPLYAVIYTVTPN